MNQHQLRAIGFCGIDDSCDPSQLVEMAKKYPLIEFGALFRPDKEGLPRYPTMAFIQRLSTQIGSADSAEKSIRLAAHLCGSRVNQVLDGDDSFVRKLVDEWGCFGRIQINATAVNGVDTSRLAEQVPEFSKLMEKFPTVEFILQKNEETEPLWKNVLSYHNNNLLGTNISMLVDESKGTGVAASSWPSAGQLPYRTGYAGGIGPSNIRTVLPETILAAQGKPFWIDMESSLRSTTDDGKDIFDLEKCQQVMDVAVELGVITVE